MFTTVSGTRILSPTQLWGLLLIYDKRPSSTTEFCKLINEDGFDKSLANACTLVASLRNLSLVEPDQLRLTKAGTELLKNNLAHYKQAIDRYHSTTRPRRKISASPSRNG